MSRVYCAGPLFTASEQGEMSEIASALEDAGHTTFLPHRDGLEFAHLLPELSKLGLNQRSADNAVQRAIFALDIFQLLSACDAVVANLNGRVPDEGTVVEASLAWLSGKALVLYKADPRTVLFGSENPMLIGLGNFSIVESVADIPSALARKLDAPDHNRVSEVLRMGEHIATARRESRDRVELAKLLRDRLAPECGDSHEAL